jgi:hypothetical protein
MLQKVLDNTSVGETVSWSERGGYSFPKLTKEMRKLLEPYKIGKEQLSPPSETTFEPE